MFQFSTFALLQSVFNRLGFPIRKSADQVIFANPRSLSQLITSFIASESQGIPRVPFLTFFYLCRLLLGMVCLYLVRHFQNQEPRFKNQDRSPVPLLLVSCIFQQLPICCLLFQFTSSNM